MPILVARSDRNTRFEKLAMSEKVSKSENNGRCETVSRSQKLASSQRVFKKVSRSKMVTFPPFLFIRQLPINVTAVKLGKITVDVWALGI